MRKISMFGISGSGKTCFLYAMAQILQGGAKQGDFRLSMIANDINQQTILNNGYMQMAQGIWPPGTNVTTEFDLRVRVQFGGEFQEIIPSLILLDYTGGVWQDVSNRANQGRDEIMNAFSDSSSILFLVDGKTLLQAMDPVDLHPSHRNVAVNTEIVQARQQISFIENLFMLYKQRGYSVPPVMVVVTKADVFADKAELEKGKALVKEYLPSLFARGSGVEVGITDVSLGTNLSAGEGNRIKGNLSLSTQYNIHLPIVYGLYAYLSEVYEDSPQDEQALIERLAVPLRAMMNGKVEMFNNGCPVINL